MDYGGILARAWQITWRRKGLWVLGFLVALSSGLGAGTNYRFRFGDTDWRQWFLGLPATIVFDIPRIVLVALGAIGLVALVLWLVALAPRAGLICGVQQEQEEGSTTLASAWRAGSKRFWTMAGIGVLAVLPNVLLLLLGAVAVALMLRGKGDDILAAILAFDGGAMLRLAYGALLCGAGVLCGVAILSVILEQTRIYAERAAVHEGLGSLRAFRRGWAILRGNLAATIVFWLLILLIGIAVAAIVGGIVAAVVVPLLSLFRSADQGVGPVVLFILGGLLSLLIGALVGSAMQTFMSATWTLVYRELRHYVPAPPPDLASKP